MYHVQLVPARSNISTILTSLGCRQEASTESVIPTVMLKADGWILVQSNIKNKHKVKVKALSLESLTNKIESKPSKERWMALTKITIITVIITAHAESVLDALSRVFRWKQVCYDAQEVIVIVLHNTIKKLPTVEPYCVNEQRLKLYELYLISSIQKKNVYSNRNPQFCC